jgi:hypothetical protein
MTSEFEEGSHWMSENDDLVKIISIDGSQVYFCYTTELAKEYRTSKPVFQIFYRRLEPEEEGLMLLGSLPR